MSAMFAQAGVVAPAAKTSPETENNGATQALPAHSALDALCLIARLHHVAADPAALRHQLGKALSEPMAADDLLRAARHLGLKAKRSATGAERLHLAALPALALMRDGRFVVLA